MWWLWAGWLCPASFKWLFCLESCFWKQLAVVFSFNYVAVTQARLCSADGRKALFKRLFFPLWIFFQLPATQTSAGVRESSCNLVLQMIHIRDSAATSRLPNLLVIQEPEHNTSASLFSLCMTMGRMEKIHLDFLTKSSKSPGILQCVEKFF